MSRKPYFLSFRLRADKQTVSTYQNVQMLLKVGNTDRVTVATGYMVERQDWYMLEGQQFVSRNFVRIAAVENRLDAIRDQIDTIYRYQLRKAQAEGWTVTSRSVVRQFQGKPPRIIIRPIQPCSYRWQIINTYSVRRAAAHA